MTGLPALDRHAAQAREMTADDVAVIRAVSCGPFALGARRGTIRLLHARSFTANRFITLGEAKTLRACVVLLKDKLNPAIVKMAGVEL